MLLQEQSEGLNNKDQHKAKHSKHAPAQFYIDNVLPRIKEKKIMALKPFVNQLGYVNVPQEINRLRCGANYHALKFLPEIEQMADLLASRMRNRTGSSNPYMALHLRFEKGMVRLKRYLEMRGADGGPALEKLMCFACILDMAWRPSTLMKV